MTAQDLKNSILQLAVQGKLVPQNPSDEPASELLKRIRAEKVTACHAGIIKKDRKLPEIEETELPYDTPDTWEWLRLGQLCQLLDGVKMSGVKYPYLEAKYLRGKIEGTNIDSGKFVKKGTMLILVDGENSGEVFFASEDGYMGSTFKVLYIPEAVYVPYVLYFLLLKKQLFRNRKTGAAIPHLNKELFFNLLFPVPPLAEQERIVAKIEELLPLVSEYDGVEKRISALNTEFPDKLRKSILQQAVQGKLTERDPSDEPAIELLDRIRAEKAKLIAEGKIKKEKIIPVISEEDQLFDIPDTWTWTTIADTCTNIQYGTSEKSAPSGKVAVLRMGNLQGGKIDYSNLVYTSNDYDIERCHLEYNDLLFNRTNSKELVGKTAIYKAEIPAIYAGYLIRVTPIMIDSDYLNYVMQSRFFKKYCLAVKTDAIGQSNINAEKLKRFVFPLPPLAEQKRIVACVEELLAMCDALK
jgi:type I restriction enzyme S subunit